MNNEFISSRQLLPLAGGLISVSQDGVIQDCKNKIVKSYKNNKNELVVKLSWIDGYREYEVSRLVALTFKPLRIPMHYWFSIELLFKDDNKLNVHPSNLIWRFPEGGIESRKYHGFYYVPGFTRYLINRDGELISSLSGKLLQGSIRPKGYIYYCLKSDTGQTSTVGKHRILALTFLKFSKLVDRLDVNHIDGYPGNNDISNLEWTTRSENMLHAYSSSLRDDNKSVIVTNHKTGEETEYYSAHECERQLNLKRSTVHYRIKAGNIYPPGLSFKYKNPNQGSRNIGRQYGMPVSIKNLDTGKIINFPSVSQCSTYLNVSKKVIQRRLKEDPVITYKTYEITKQHCRF